MRARLRLLFMALWGLVKSAGQVGKSAEIKDSKSGSPKKRTKGSNKGTNQNEKNTKNDREYLLQKGELEQKLKQDIKEVKAEDKISSKEKVALIEKLKEEAKEKHKELDNSKRFKGSKARVESTLKRQALENTRKSGVDVLKVKQKQEEIKLAKQNLEVKQEVNKTPNKSVADIKKELQERKQSREVQSKDNGLEK